MKSIRSLIAEKPWLGWVLFAATVALVFLLGLFAATVVERRQEAYASRRLVQLPPIEPRNAVWGKNHPRQYESYRKTAESRTLTEFGGSAPIDLLAKDPRLVVLWAGYAFSRDYNQGRGHTRAVEDIRKTLRTDVPQPGTCWTCKSTDVPRLMGSMGVTNYYASKWSNLGAEVVNDIGCQDCHDPATMELRITRPALVEALAAQGKEITRATHQEMRSLVCAQCHVEYYFKGKEKVLTFPWKGGMGVEAMEAYYDDVKHVDFVHSLSRTPVLKAQHPDYEVFSSGIHAERGVSCADCHMPYRSEGGVKTTDHHIRSPLENIANSCGVCHRESEETLRRNVVDRQVKIEELKAIAEEKLVRAHVEAKDAWDGGATSNEMADVLQRIRHAQWRWDYIAAANANGFHSPIESARVLGTAIQKAEEARLALNRVRNRLGRVAEVPYPPIETKAAAQRFIGLDMDKLRASKEAFLKAVLPVWDEAAKKRESAYPAGL